MRKELISVIEVAKNLGKHKAYIFKILKRLRIDSVKQKSSDAKGQKIAYITTDEYERVKKYITDSQNYSNDSSNQSDIGGVFYLIQLEPNFGHGRFKVGFATSINERVRKYKTIAPFVKVLKTWPCKSGWEKTAIDCVSQGCEKLYTEVFRTNSIDEVLMRCEEFFGTMPKLLP